MVHALQFEGVENRLEDGQARRENRPAIGLDAFEIDLVRFTELEYPALEPGQPFGVDLAGAVTTGLEGQADGPNGP
ncbi:hypothetical protein D3C76_1624940 [compost metagenome]